MNIYDSEKYQQNRKEMEKYFTDDNQKFFKEINFKNYNLKIYSYETEKGCWDYTRGIVTKNNEVIADIKRNYSSFPQLFVSHLNGNDYLLCGEDYQGYTIVNLNTQQKFTYIPEDATKGWGFCWIDIQEYDPDFNELTVEGCYWGAESEYVTYDFSNPDNLPLEDLSRSDADLEIYDDEDE